MKKYLLSSITLAMMAAVAVLAGAGALAQSVRQASGVSISAVGPSTATGFIRLDVTVNTDPFTPINKIVVYTPQKYILGTYRDGSAFIDGNVWHVGFDTIGLNNGNNKLTIDAFTCRGLDRTMNCVKVASTAYTLQAANGYTFNAPWIKIATPEDGVTVTGNGGMNTINAVVAIKNFDLRYPPKVYLTAMAGAGVSSIVSDNGSPTTLCTFNGIRVMTYNCKVMNLVNGLYVLTAKAVPTPEYLKQIPLADTKVYTSPSVSVTIKQPITATVSMGGSSLLKSVRATVSAPSSLNGQSYVLVFNKFDNDYDDMGPSSAVHNIGYYTSVTCKTPVFSNNYKQASFSCDFKPKDLTPGEYTLSINNANGTVVTVNPMYYSVR
ncbi:MAG: hypothetical protein WCO55_05250 [Candidatus Falkowbacteria bacterium]